MNFCYAEEHAPLVERLPSPEQILSINDDLKALIDQHLEGYLGIHKKSQRLHQLFFAPEFENIQYSPNATYTAQEVFDHKRGNCVGLANLFIAAARYVGLNAHFQLVEIPRQWQPKEDYFIVPEHMNVGIFDKKYAFNAQRKKVKWSKSSVTDNVDIPASTSLSFEIADNIRPTYVVEFLSVFLNQNLKGASYEVISDQQAMAEYYNNLSVDQIADNNLQQAVEILEASIKTYKKSSFVWSNLGYVYKKSGLIEQAEHAYLKAYSLDKKNYSAVKNLYVLYKSTGNAKKASRYQKRVDRYNQKNPYHHSRLADNAMHAEDYDAAVSYYKKAIRLDPDQDGFHHKIAVAYYKLGNMKASQKHLKKANKLAGLSENNIAYQDKIDSIHGIGISD